MGPLADPCSYMAGVVSQHGTCIATWILNQMEGTTAFLGLKPLVDYPTKIMAIEEGTPDRAPEARDRDAGQKGERCERSASQH